MKTIKNYIRWLWVRRDLETNLRRYIAVEYKNHEAYGLFKEAYDAHRAAILRS
jgi:hypothetical protein